MANLAARLKKLETKRGGIKQVIVLYINGGETEVEAKTRYLAGNTTADLESENANVIVVQYV